MKIAILYSGRIFNHDLYFKNLQYFILQNHDVDIFLSHSKELNEDLSPFIELYKPKIVIDEPILFKGRTMHYNGVCMFTNRYRLFKEFKQYCQTNSISYDYVVIYRLDVITLYPINFNLFNNTDDNLIYVPNIEHSGGVTDFMAIGNSNAIEKYCNLIVEYDTIYDITHSKDSNEAILLNYLNKIGLQIKLFPFSCILRLGLRKDGGSRHIVISKEEEEELIIK